MEKIALIPEYQACNGFHDKCVELLFKYTRHCIYTRQCVRISGTSGRRLLRRPDTLLQTAPLDRLVRPPQTPPPPKTPFGGGGGGAKGTSRVTHTQPAFAGYKYNTPKSTQECMRSSTYMLAVLWCVEIRDAKGEHSCDHVHVFDDVYHP